MPQDKLPIPSDGTTSRLASSTLSDSIQNEALNRYRTTYGNKLWRLSHLYKIRDKNKKLIPFKFNNIQGKIITILEDCIKNNEPMRLFFLKFRQGGVSTLLLLWWLDDAIFTSHTANGVLSHKQESLNLLSGIIRTGYNYMPSALRPKLVKDNIAELEFPNGSKIFTSLDIRSTAVHNLHISEWCFCEDEKIAASIGAVPPTGNITGESTGNGIGNDGYITYQEAKQGISPFKSYFFPWFIQNEYRIKSDNAITFSDEENKLIKKAKSSYEIKVDKDQIEWRRYMKKTQKGMAGQEFPEDDEEAFIKSGKFHFNQAKILTLLQEAKDHFKTNPPIEETDDYIIFERPIEKHIYVAGVDTAEGVGGDFSTISIINASRNRQAFRLKAQMSIAQFFRACDKWGRYFNNALMAVESNNHGHAIIQGLDEICNYPNLWYESNEKRTRVISTGISAIQEREYGWRTTSGNRTLVLDNLKLAIEGELEEDIIHFQPEWLVLDKELLFECLTFVDINGKYQASAGKHDDIIMANCLAHQMYMRSHARIHSNLSIRKSGEREYRI